MAEKVLEEAKAVMGNRGGGKSSVVRGSMSPKPIFGPDHSKGTAGTKRFDLGTKSLNRGGRK